MTALREVFAEFDVEFDRRRALERGNRAVNRSVQSLRRIGPAAARAASALGQVAAVAGGAAAAGLARIVSSTVEAERELDRWAGRLSTSREDLRSWIELGREYGASIDDVTDALKELQLKARDAIGGGTEQAEMFERIGISVDDLRPVVNDVNALMGLFTTRLNENTDAATRNFTVDEIMSDAGTRLNEVFALGTEEITRRRGAITQSIGPTNQLSSAIASHTRYVISMTRRWEQWKREITLRILPLLQRADRALKDLREPLEDLIRETDILEGALVGLGVVAVAVAALTITTWGPVVLTILAVAAAVAAVAVAYDQVKRTIEGSDTALRTFLDDSDRLGEDGTAGTILLLGDAWDRLTSRLERAWNALRPIIDGFRQLDHYLSYLSFGRHLEAGLERVGELTGYGLGEAARERVAEERARQRGESRERNREIARAEDRLAAGGSGALDYFDLPVSRDTPRTRGRGGGLPPLPTSTPRSSPRRQTTISAPMTVDLSISEATDVDRVRREVRREIETSQGRWIRELEAMLDESEAAT